MLDRRLPIARKGADYAAYQAHIGALYGWLKPLNTAVWGLPWPASLDPARRAGKIALLEADLARAHPEPHTPIGLPPLCPRIPRITTLDPYTMGVAYVIEGSQLGGAMLARRFEALPVSYLLGYGADTAALWTQFQSFLNAALAGAEARAQALSGACDAFDTLSAWLSERHVLRQASHAH
jgi:heme oxygenase